MQILLLKILKGIYKGTRTVLFGSGYYCNYIPSCSEYAFDLLAKKPFIKAIFMISLRVISCSVLTRRLLYRKHFVE